LIYKLIVWDCNFSSCSSFWISIHFKKVKNNLPIWTSTTKVMLLQLAILVVGGVLSSFNISWSFAFLAPATLLFYGLALVNAGKYTYSDIQYLGYFQLFLGSVSLFFLGYGLIFGPLVLEFYT
jgi:hypothetical protein